jgi:hypothetical protein
MAPFPFRRFPRPCVARELVKEPLRRSQLLAYESRPRSQSRNVSLISWGASSAVFWSTKLCPTICHIWAASSIRVGASGILALVLLTVAGFRVVGLRFFIFFTGIVSPAGGIGTSRAALQGENREESIPSPPLTTLAADETKDDEMASGLSRGALFTGETEPPPTFTDLSWQPLGTDGKRVRVSAKTVAGAGQRRRRHQLDDARHNPWNLSVDGA